MSITCVCVCVCVHTCAFVCVWSFTPLGQLRQMIREEDHDDEDQFRMSHVMIPAAYSSGVTVFALRDSDQGQELLHAPELPLL